MRNSLKLLFLSFVLVFSNADSFGRALNDPVITLQSGTKLVTFTRTELLLRKDVKEIEASHTSAFKKESFKFKAIPLTRLFETLKPSPDSTILFKCTDGFSAPLKTDRILNESPNQAVAYLAIEPRSPKWPLMKRDARDGKGKTAGPFYLIWENPELSKIGSEEWPYQLAGFEVKKPLNETYPLIVPDSKLKADHSVQKGFALFTKNCFMCHTLNLQGEAKMGPDLNAPMSPSEYFSEQNFKKLVRNPQSLRHWPESKMAGFPPEALSDHDLSDLYAYLKHMSERRK